MIFNQTVRRLWWFDRAAISDHFQRLDRDALRQRFGIITSEDYVRIYAEKLQQLENPIYGAFVDGEIRAVAELHSIAGVWPPQAEVALSVETDWQDQGIGDTLISRIIVVVQNRGVKSLHMMCMRENKRMQHLAAKHHSVLKFDRSEVEATLDPSWPTANSLAEEFMAETRGLAHALFNL